MFYMVLNYRIGNMIGPLHQARAARCNGWGSTAAAAAGLGTGWPIYLDGPLCRRWAVGAPTGLSPLGVTDHRPVTDHHAVTARSPIRRAMGADTGDGPPAPLTADDVNGDTAIGRRQQPSDRV